MFGFKKKNYLKRTDFINSVDSNKIWSKSMTIPEIKSLLEHLEVELSKYEFDEDTNFIMNNRRKGLKREIEERLQKNNGDINDTNYNKIPRGTFNKVQTNLTDNNKKQQNKIQ